jgi:ATP-binding cassette subfamily B protein
MEKREMIDDVSASWRLLTGNAWWAVRRTWGISRSLCATLLGSSLVSALVPSILTLVIGMLVNEVKLALEDQQPDIKVVATWLALAALIILVGNAANIVNQYCRLRLTDELRLAISKETFEHSTTLDLAFFEDPKSQDILSRATQNPGGDFLSFVVDAIGTLELSVQMASLLAVMVWIDPLVTPLLFAVAIPWFLFRWHIAKIRFSTLRSKTTKRRWNRYFMGRLITREAVPVVKLLRLAPLLLHRFEESLKELMEIDRKIYKKQAIGGIAAAVLFTLGFLLVLGLVGYRSLQGRIEFQYLITYLLAAFRLRNSVVEFINRLSSSLERVLSITNLQEFLDTKPNLVDTGVIRSGELKGIIELRDVSFSYPGNDRKVLNKINMRIQPGETIALVGPNGSGKTTLVKLITRLYELDDGSILIDGQEIKRFNLDFLHSQIAYVDQQGVRFEATAHENIAYGDWRRLMESREEVRQIAERTRIASMIEKMPEGFDTRLGRMFGQFDLSGGQWQKIAIARAVAKNAGIYILDEPTAHLDAKSEYEIFASLKDAVQGKTAILISHRFTTARMADRIFVINEGQVVQVGTHNELLQQSGLYKELYGLHELTFNSNR